MEVSVLSRHGRFAPRKELGGPRSLSGRFEEQRNLVPAESLTTDRPVRSLVTVPKYLQ
jgi:hypothetical protein